MIVIRKLLKNTMIIILSIVGLSIIAYLLFTNFYPNFGGDVSKARLALYEKCIQFNNGRFHNKNPVPSDRSFFETLQIAYKFFFTEVPNGRPKGDLKPCKIDSADVAKYAGPARLFWYGHSSFLLQVSGKTILIDPMFGKVAAPHPLFGSNRFNKEFPLGIEQLPQIDAVIFSHDHYDHLDYHSVINIKDRTDQFFVPLGVGAHLEAWKVPSNKITELDWWQETWFDDLKLVCTPAQHFSGRKLTNSQSTLWGSWVIQSTDTNIYFGGDSGYASHFSKIGEKYGPFDLALLECGQYNEMWSEIHMMPEETAQAGIDVKANKVMAIHWGSFKLALHHWKDPIERFTKKAKNLNLEIITPKIGEMVIIKDPNNNYTEWWLDLE